MSHNITPLKAFRIKNKPHYYSRSKVGIRQYLSGQNLTLEQSNKLIETWINRGLLIRLEHGHFRLCDEILRKENQANEDRKANPASYDRKAV